MGEVIRSGNQRRGDPLGHFVLEGLSMAVLPLRHCQNPLALHQSLQRYVLQKVVDLRG
jgi:hypothetical protein